MKIEDKNEKELGKVVWGQKTLLDKNSAFNRINVKRLLIHSFMQKQKSEN